MFLYVLSMRQAHNVFKIITKVEPPAQHMHNPLALDKT